MPQAAMNEVALRGTGKMPKLSTPASAVCEH